MTSTLLGTLHTVLRGRARPYARFDGRPGGMSGIDKHPVTGPVTLTAQGLEGDEQGDRRGHGGNGIPASPESKQSAGSQQVWQTRL